MIFTIKASKIALFSLVLFSFAGCSKTEGKGGAATITGKVMVQDYTVTGTPNGDPYEAYDTDVYIIYGSGTTYHDDFKTSHDGSYRFSNLRTGTYQVFVYSDIVPEPSDPPKQEVMIETITISEKKGTVTVPDFLIKKY